MICNTYEATILPVPNQQLQPQQSWTGQMPLFVLDEGKRLIQEIHLTCTYQGLRSENGRTEAYITLAGEVKSRGPRPEVLGKASGYALLDVDHGYFTRVKLTVNSEVEVEQKGSRLLISEESLVTRSDGNTLGITPARANQPVR